MKVDLTDGSDVFEMCVVEARVGDTAYAKKTS